MPSILLKTIGRYLYIRRNRRVPYIIIRLIDSGYNIKSGLVICFYKEQNNMN